MKIVRRGRVEQFLFGILFFSLLLVLHVTFSFLHRFFLIFLIFFQNDKSGLRMLKLIYLGKVLLQSFRCHTILIETRSHNKRCVSTCLSHFICHFYGVPCSCM